MRAHGLLSELPGAGGTDHICWVYEDDAAFDTAVGRFLAGGLERGERLFCVGDRIVDSLHSDAPPIDGVDRLIADGVLETLTLDEAYDEAGTFSPERQLEFYDAATRRAIDDGYRGLRVVADVSSLAADPDRRADLVRWEHLADEYIAHGPGMTAMCAYRGDLSDAALADVTTAHPLVHAPDGIPPFRVFLVDRRLAVAGSVDTFSAGRLASALAASPPDGPVAVLDLGLLRFIDIAGCRVVAAWAAQLRTRSIAVEICGASTLLRRMWDILSLSEVAPVTFAQPAR